jgi:hypothetical protein
MSSRTPVDSDADLPLLLKESNFQRVVLRAKRVAKAGAVKVLAVDHFRVAALVASREKVLRAAPVFETAWLTQAESAAKRLGFDLLTPVTTSGKEEWPLDASLKQLLSHCKTNTFAEFLQNLFSDEFSGSDKKSAKPAKSARPKSFARQDPHFERILDCAGLVAHSFSVDRVGLDLFAVGTLLAHGEGLLSDRPSLIHCLNINQHAIKKLLSHRGWDLQKISKKTSVRVTSESEEFAQALRDSAEHEDPLLSVLNLGVRIGVDLALHERVAYHEAGHAVINLALMPERGIAEVTIEKEDDSDGHVAYDQSSPWMITPTSKEDVLDTLCVALAGRVAEQRQAGHASGTDSGATSDLRQATNKAWAAITVWGMDEEFGPVVLETMIEESGLRGGWLFNEAQRHLQRVMKEAHVRTEELVRLHWAHIEKLAKSLLVKPRLSQDEVFSILPEFVIARSD